MQGDVFNGQSGYATVTNDVLPFTTTDFVSYSSYDTQQNTTGTFSYSNAVAYVAAHLPATTPDIVLLRCVILRQREEISGSHCALS